MTIPKFRAFINKRNKVEAVLAIDFVMKRITIKRDMNDPSIVYGATVSIPLGEIELMQYTGFKDVNGVEIYEGDIVNSHKNLDPFSFYKRTVIRDEDTNKLDLEPRSGFVLCKNTSSTRFEVIGNIHQHPHLLEDIENE